MLMKLRTLTTALLYLLILSSCGKNDNELLVTENDFGEPTKLTGQIIDGIEQLVPASLHILDSLLVVTDYKQNPRSHFYHKVTMEKVAEYGQIGEGPEEYRAPEWNGQVFHKPGSDDTFMRVYEFGYGMIHEVNLSAVLRGEKEVKANKFYFPPEVFNADNVFFINEGVLAEATDNKDVKYFQTSLDDMSTIEKVGTFNSNDLLDGAPIEERVNLDRSFMGYSGNQEKFIAAYLRCNKFVILNEQLDEELTIIYGNKEKGPENRDVFGENNVFYFREPVAGKNSIYLPYVGAPTKERTTANELQIYNYDGEPLQRYLLDYPLRTFAVDESTNKIFVITGMDDKPFVAYDLNI